MTRTPRGWTTRTGFTRGGGGSRPFLFFHTVRWKLRQLGVGHTTTLHDVANAFPSPHHGVLDAMVDKGNGKGDGLHARDPVSGRDVQLGHTVFADDVQETNVTRDLPELYEKIETSGDAFDDMLRSGGMGRNKDKEEHAVHMVGKGAVKCMRELRATSRLQGKLVDHTKYLGNVFTVDGRSRANVDKRIPSASQGSYGRIYGYTARCCHDILYSNTATHGGTYSGTDGSLYHVIHAWCAIHVIQPPTYHSCCFS